MFATLVDALTRPTAFFERRDPSLRSGLAVVLLTGTLRLATALPLLWAFRHLISPGEFRFVVGVGAAFMYVWVLLRWVLLGGAIYAASWPMDRDGRFRDLLGYLGWSHLPNALGAVLMLVVTLGVVATITPPRTEEAAARFAADLSRSPFVKLSAATGLVESRTGVSLDTLQYLVGIAQFAWGAVVWYAASTVSLGLDDRQALLSVVLPIVVGGLVVGFRHVSVGVTI